MDNFFLLTKNFEIIYQSLYISYNYIHLEKKPVNLKNGYLRKTILETIKQTSYFLPNFHSVKLF
jgi:hypothetical protein